MTTEQERKAAAEKLVRLIAPSYADDELAIGVADRLLSGNGSLSIDKAIDLQCALTHTEKRLEVAEGLLREAMVHVAKFPLDSRLRALYLAIRNFLQSTSRGGVER